MFAGEKSATADRQALAKAREMEAAGAGREAIWKETGWWKPEHDGKWRYEIDDSRARLAPGFGDALQSAQPGQVVVGTPRPGTRFFDPVPMPNVIEHRQLYQAYPGMAKLPPEATASGINVGVIVGKSDEPSGFTKPGRDQREAGADPQDYSAAQHIEIYAPSHKLAKDIALHEANHGVAHIEGFGRGTTPDQPGYATNPEELIARAVESRRAMSADQRRAVPPWQTIGDLQAADAKPAPKRPQVPGQEDWKHPESVKGPDGIAPAVRRAARDVDNQREAWETLLRGMLSNDPRNSGTHLHPGMTQEWLQNYAREQLAKPDHGFVPQTEQEMQGIVDSIDKAEGGRSNGLGAVYRGPGDPPPYQAPAKPVQKRFKGSDLGAPFNVAGFAAASHAYHAAGAPSAHHAGTVSTIPATGANHRRGFQNPNNLRAALAAQGKATSNVKG